jgi:5-methylcytosine-specific restriction endonuclease McrA
MADETVCSDLGARKKVCRKCGEAKPLCEFNRTTQNKDGHSGACKSCATAYVLDWQKRYPEKMAAKAARYREKNRERLALRAREIRLRDSERLEANRRRYLAKKPYAITDSCRRRRARLKNAPKIEEYDSLEIAKRDGWKCHICGKRVKRGQLSIDHLVPLSRGGDDTPQNVALAHLRCNSRRGPGRLPAQLRLFG